MSEPYEATQRFAVTTPPRFVWPLAGPFGAVILGVIAVMSLV